MDWATWKKAKAILSNLADSPAVRHTLLLAVASFEESEGDISKLAAKIVDPETTRVVLSAAAAAIASADELVDLVLANCVDGSTVGISPAAALAIRQAVTDMTDIPGLLTLEKNWLAGIVKSLASPQSRETTASNNGAAA